MNRLAGQGADHSLYGLNPVDDQLPKSINVIGRNAGEHVVGAADNLRGVNAGDLSRL